MTRETPPLRYEDDSLFGKYKVAAFMAVVGYIGFVAALVWCF